MNKLPWNRDLACKILGRKYGYDRTANSRKSVRKTTKEGCFVLLVDGKEVTYITEATPSLTRLVNQIDKGGSIFKIETHLQNLNRDFCPYITFGAEGKSILGVKSPVDKGWIRPTDKKKYSDLKQLLGKTLKFVDEQEMIRSVLVTEVVESTNGKMYIVYNGRLICEEELKDRWTHQNGLPVKFHREEEDDPIRPNNG